MITRRSFLVRASLAAAGGLPAVAGERDAFTFGLTPVLVTDDRQLLAHLRAYLEQRLRQPVKLVQRRTYQEITALLLAGQLDAAWICGYPYVVHRDVLALVGVPLWKGRPLYQSYLIVQADREAEGLSDLRGDIHAFSDPDSNSGYLVTRTRLAEMGESPQSFFARFFFTYGHRNVVRAVAAGLAQSGSVDGYVWEVLKATEPGLVAPTRPVQKSDWLGFPPVAALKSRMHEPAIRAFTDALRGMADDPDGRAVLTLLHLDGFAAADPSVFDGIAAQVRFLADRA
jgi:phosphonate transport system substrate-binding protein